VLSNQPQGGFVTRKPTAPMTDETVADGNFWGDDGARSLFQPNRNVQTDNMRPRGGQLFFPGQRSLW
jgi:hypothetical protein